MDINRYSPSYGVNRKHLLGLAEYSTEEIFEILYATKAMKAKFAAHENTGILQGVTVVTFFGETSLRTRPALEIGVRQLGGALVNLAYSAKELHSGENAKDIVSVISRYGVGALVTRGFDRADLDGFCSVSEISIINSGNNDCVPLQALSDLYTIWEKCGKLEGVKIAYVGKGTATASSLITGAIKCGMEVAVATPEEFSLKPSILNNAMQYGNITLTPNPAEAVRNADFVYTDGYGALPAKEKSVLAPYQVNAQLLSSAAYNAYFMHPLPAERGTEVTGDVIDGKRSLVAEQGENKLHAIKAVLALLI